MGLMSWLRRKGAASGRPAPHSATVRLSVEALDERVLPSHVRLPLPPPDPPGIQVAAVANPHAGGFKTALGIPDND